MGSVGDCFDNAVCETFHATLKKERIYRQSWPTRAVARTAIFEFIEGWYNPRRRHSTLGYLSPADFERLHARPARPTLQAAISDDGSVQTLTSSASDGLTTRRMSKAGVDFAARQADLSDNVRAAPAMSAQAATAASQETNHHAWPLRRVGNEHAR